MVRLTALALVLLTASNAAKAQYAITWFTIDAGGGTSSGGQFTLSGTIGQPDAGATMTGGQFTVTGGFWAGGGTTCRVDLNSDGIADFNDYLEFLNLYNTNDPRVDFNDDGTVDFNDYLEFLNLYNQGC